MTEATPLYPVARAFEADVRKHIRDPRVRDVGLAFARMLLEYEHGTADIKDVSPKLTLRAASALLFDSLLYYQGERQEES